MTEAVPFEKPQEPFDEIMERVARAIEPETFLLPRINLNKPVYERAYKRARAAIEAITQPVWPTVPMGCICPPGANKECEAPMCPRKPYNVSWNNLPMTLFAEDPSLIVSRDNARVALLTAYLREALHPYNGKPITPDLVETLRYLVSAETGIPTTEIAITVIGDSFSIKRIAPSDGSPLPI